MPETMSAVQEYITYCTLNSMRPDELGSAAFFANRRKIDGREITPGEWNDLVDFAAPDAPVSVCPLPPGPPRSSSQPPQGRGTTTV